MLKKQSIKKRNPQLCFPSPGILTQRSHLSLTNTCVDSSFAQTDYQHLKLQETPSETLRMRHIFLFPDLKVREEGTEPQRFSVTVIANFWEYSSNCKVLLKTFGFGKIRLLNMPGIKYGLCEFRTYQKPNNLC